MEGPTAFARQPLPRDILCAQAPPSRTYFQVPCGFLFFFFLFLVAIFVLLVVLGGILFGFGFSGFVLGFFWFFLVGFLSVWGVFVPFLFVRGVF